MFGDLGRWAADVLGAYGSLGLAALMLAENVFPPIPSEAVLPLAGFLVGKGEIGAAQALVASTAGSLAGAGVLYALGRWGGRSLVLRHGKLLRVGEADLDRAEGRFERYGGLVVFFARMVPLARSVVSIPAGAAKMPPARFAFLTTAGSALWNALLDRGRLPARRELVTGERFRGGYPRSTARSPRSFRVRSVLPVVISASLGLLACLDAVSGRCLRRR